MLNQSWASVYTLPQTTQNQLAFLTASGSWRPSETLSLQGNVYYRGYWQHHADGNGTNAQNSGCPDPDFICFPDLNGDLSSLVGLNGLPVPAIGVLANSENVNDIINVASPIIGHSYFQNGGNTLRQGVEAGVSLKWDRWTVYANYTWVDAIFETPLVLSSPFNPFADANGQIFVAPGDHIPAVPNYRFKAGVEYKGTDAWKLGADINAVGSQYLVGDQSNQNPKVPAYWVLNMHSSYQVARNVEVFCLVRNLFNQRYYLQGTFFQTDSFPYLNLTDPRTFIPGMPLAIYAGVRATL